MGKQQLKELIGDRDYRLFLNPRNELYKARNMKDNPPTREEALELLSKNPNLLRRPILVKGDEVVVGYDEKELKRVIKS